MHRFRARLIQFHLAAKKDNPKDKKKSDKDPRTNFIDKLTEKDEEILNKIWDRQRGQKKKALDVGDGEETDAKGGKGGFFGTSGFRDFWKEVYESGKKKFPNPNPDSKKSHPQVSANTLLKSSKPFRDKVLKDYAKWRDGQKDKDKGGKDSSKGEKKRIHLAEDRYENTEFGMTDSYRETLKGMGLTPEKVADVCGLGVIPAKRRMVSITGTDTEIRVRSEFFLEGGGRVVMLRDINPQTMSIHNDILRVESAPKGLGTKIFASQIQEARAAGFKEVVCSALTRPPRWNGTLVWPKLGYDAPLPSKEDYFVEDDGDTTGWTEEVYDEAVEMLQEQGFKEPFKISMLMQSKEGREFWAEHTPSWVNDMTFDLDEDSQSSKVLQSYIEAKGLV